MSRKPKHTFVRRLIPTVAAASLAFTGCSPPDNNDKGSDTGMSGGMDMSGGENNGGDDTGGGGGDDMGGGGGDDMGGGGGDDMGGGGDDMGGGGDDMAMTGNTDPMIRPTFTADGMITREEIESVCQAWSGCDSYFFQDSYSTVEECTNESWGYIEERLSYVEMEYGTDCANVIHEFIDCLVSSAYCLDGGIAAPQADYDACYSVYEMAYEAECQ